MSQESLRQELRQRLGYRPLSRGWAKLEILLGLFAARAGFLVAIHPTMPFPWEFAGVGLVLFVLGGYLALAGHRSHLYQSTSEQVALLVEEIRKVDSREHRT